MHVITGEVRKEPRRLDNGTIIVELAESYKTRDGQREYTNYAFFFKANSDGMQKWYDDAFQVGKVVTVTCDKLKVNQREHNGTTYITLQAAGFANLEFSQFGAASGQSNGGQQQQQQQQQRQQPQRQQQQSGRQPPMDFDADIPFASFGLQYATHAIHSL